MDNLSVDIEWLLKHVAVIVNDISHGKRANWQKDRPMVDFGSIFGRGSTMIRSTWSIFKINSSLHLCLHLLLSGLKSVLWLFKP